MPRSHTREETITKAKQAWEMKQKGWTTVGIARKMGVATSTVHLWLKSPPPPRLPHNWAAPFYTETSQPVNVDALLEHIPAAIETLGNIVKSDRTTTSEKLKAIEIIGKWAGIADGIDGAITILRRAGYKVIDPSLKQTVEVESKGLTEEDFYAIQQGILGGSQTEVSE